MNGQKQFAFLMHTLFRLVDCLFMRTLTMYNVNVDLIKRFSLAFGGTKKISVGQKCSSSQAGIILRDNMLIENLFSSQ